MAGRSSWAKKWAPYKSGLEAAVAADMKKKGVEFEYESETLTYSRRVTKGVCDACGGNKTSQRHTYLPDFVLGLLQCGPGSGETKIYIETKGFFSPSDRAKMVAVKQEHPELDIRLIFGADNKLNKKKNERYSDWAKVHGFRYSVGPIYPNDWGQELQLSSGVQINPDRGPVRRKTKGKERP